MAAPRGRPPTIQPSLTPPARQETSGRAAREESSGAVQGYHEEELELFGKDQPPPLPSGPLRGGLRRLHSLIGMLTLSRWLSRPTLANHNRRLDQLGAAGGRLPMVPMGFVSNLILATFGLTKPQSYPLSPAAASSGTARRDIGRPIHPPFPREPRLIAGQTGQCSSSVSQ